MDNCCIEAYQKSPTRKDHSAGRRMGGGTIMGKDLNKLLENIEDLKWANDPISCRIHMLSYIFPKEAEKLASAAYDLTESINTRLKIDRRSLERQGLCSEYVRMRGVLDDQISAPHTHFKEQKAKRWQQKEKYLLDTDPDFLDYQEWNKNWSGVNGIPMDGLIFEKTIELPSTSIPKTNILSLQGPCPANKHGTSCGEEVPWLFAG